MRVRWQKGARYDLRTIVTYIYEDSPNAARRVYTMIIEDVSRLAEFSEVGRAGRIAGTRELVISNLPYIVAYRVTDTEVRILKVMHTSRKWPRKFAEEEN